MKRTFAIAGNFSIRAARTMCFLSALIVLFMAENFVSAQVIDFLTKPEPIVAPQSISSDNSPQLEPLPAGIARPDFDRFGTESNPGGDGEIRFERYLHDQWEGWSIDYRERQLHSAFTSYEFGMPDSEPVVWSPLSRLVFEMDSTWHGLQIQRRTPNADIRFEWLTPIGNGIIGNMNDYDWMIPGADFTDLGITRERWTDGQMLDFNLEYRLLDHIFVLPVEFWLSGGFRWQRFNISAYDAVQVKEGNVWPPDPWRYDGDVITFNQQYYTEYLGGEFRSTLAWIPSLPLELRLFGDYGGTQAYNVDHHLLREGDRYTMESTFGDTLHYGLSAELYLMKNLSVGAEYEQLVIRTHGEHRWYNEPYGTDERWTNGVDVRSDQSWFTVYVRIRV
jgi:hypothetical protein